MTERLDQTEQPEFVRTFTSFSGADMIATINAETIGELQSVSWEENFLSQDEYLIDGVITVAIFDQASSLLDIARRKREFNIAIVYEDEYGNKMSVRICGCKIHKRSGRNSVDDPSLEEQYFFRAKRIRQLSGRELEEQGVSYT